MEKCPKPRQAEPRAAAGWMWSWGGVVAASQHPGTARDNDPTLLPHPMAFHPQIPAGSEALCVQTLLHQVSSPWIGVQFVIEVKLGAFHGFPSCLPFPFEGEGFMWLGGVNAARKARETQVDVFWFWGQM